MKPSADRRSSSQFTDILVNSQFNYWVIAVPTVSEMIYAGQRHGKPGENKDGQPRGRLTRLTSPVTHDLSAQQHGSVTWNIINTWSATQLPVPAAAATTAAVVTRLWHVLSPSSQWSSYGTTANSAQVKIETAPALAAALLAMRLPDLPASFAPSHANANIASSVRRERKAVTAWRNISKRLAVVMKCVS